MSRTRYVILVSLLLAGVGASAVFGRLGSPFATTGFRELRVPLTAFPRDVGGWHGTDRPLDPRALEVTGVDHYLRREYVRGGGERALFFVAYYGNKDRGLAAIYHKPTVCLPAAGFTWVSSERRAVTLREQALDFSVSLDCFRRETGEEMLILNFFVVDERRVLAQSPRNDPFWLGLEKALPTFDPGYLAQVQVATAVVGGDRAAAAERALRFGWTRNRRDAFTGGAQTRAAFDGALARGSYSNRNGFIRFCFCSCWCGIILRHLFEVIQQITKRLSC